MPATEPAQPARVHPVVDRMAAYAWRLIVLGVVALALLWVLRELRVVVFPLIVAVFLSRALFPIATVLRRWHVPTAMASLLAMLLFLGALGGLIAAMVPTFTDQVEDLGPTLSKAVDDIENWLVEDSPFHVSRANAAEIRDRIGREIDRLTNSPDGSITERAHLVAEFAVGAFLALVLTFFMLRDGRRFIEWVSKAAPTGKEAQLRRALDAAWETLAGYLRGATVLGVVEAAVIGVTLWLAGGSLVIPVMVLTFLGAYVPIVGAIASGVVAVLVALVTGGTGSAVVVAIVAFVVQQIDNEVLAPFVYGRTLHLHPVVILISVVAGGALLGLAGTLLAVPVVAVAVNAAKPFREGHR